MKKNTKLISELATFIRGVTYKKDDATKKPQKEYIPILRANNINDVLNNNDLVFVPKEKIKKEQIIKKNDIVICMSSGSKNLVGKSAQSNENITSSFGAFCGVVRPNDTVNGKYLGYFFHSPFYRSTVSKASLGVNINNLKQSDINSLSLDVPPLPTQQKIVDKIESLFSKIDSGNTSLQKAKVLLEQYRQSVLKAAFEGKLTAQWREKHKGELEPASVLLERIRKERKKKLGEKFKELPLVNTKELPKLPDGWCWCRLEQITLILGDGLHGTPNYDDKGDFYFINGNNLVDGKIVFKNNTKKVSKNEFEKYRKSLDETTIFVSINGTIGNTAFYNEENIILGKSACYFNVLSVAIKQYVRYYLTTNQFIVYAHKKAKGSTIKNVGLKAMRDFLIPLPNSKKEQKLIIKILQNHIETSNRILEDINKKLCQSNLLKNSILKNAFEGKLINE